MYNRYIPQSDGTYRRKQIQDLQPQPPKSKPCPPEKPKDPPPKPPMDPCEKEPPRNPPCRQCPQQSAGGFLRNLLPKDFDTGDLLIILLLLIMAGDSEEGQNNALLTLALDLFM